VDFPIFGQNPAMAAAAQVAQAAPSAPAGGAQTASAQTASAQTAPASAGNPSGFLDMVRATQHDYVNADSTGPKHSLSLFGDNGFGFHDVLDAINPLQHIPIISTLYRAITGDKIDVAPRLIGGAIYGGFFGFLSEAVNAAVEDSTGHDIGENVRLALFGGPDNAPREPVMFAGNQPATPQVADAAAASAGAEPWYRAGAANAASNAMAANPQIAAADTASSDGANGDGANTPTLTPAQLSLLQEYGPDQGIAGIAPAAGTPLASAPPKPGNALDLTPAQADLLMRSVGLKPPAKSDAAPTAPSAQSVELPAGDADAVTPSASPDDSGSASENDSSNDSGPLNTPQKPAPSPVIKAAGVPGAKDKADFAQRMQFGLDRYMAHPMPVNTKPPHLDVIQ